MTREQCLGTAREMVMGSREDDYGTPENNFNNIAELWKAYLGGMRGADLDAVDVAIMMALLKIARIKSNADHADSWVDAAGYIACGSELACGEP